MGNSFCGWYFRCQAQGESLALIPAVHCVGGVRSGSLQFISGREHWKVSFPASQCRVDGNLPRARLGGCSFSPGGVRLDLHTPALSAVGSLRFRGLSPIRYDIMGPFCRIPFLECRHSVFSMRHQVEGILRINGRDYCFSDSTGYIEGDRGRSFPRQYAWTQYCFPGGSLMLAAAEIPLGPICFTGVIGVVQLKGREYRLATYLGARAEKLSGGEIVVLQGSLTLTARLLERQAHPLAAPTGGAMTRTIRENVSCRAFYQLSRGGRPLLSLEAADAAFEFEYPPGHGA